MALSYCLVYLGICVGGGGGLGGYKDNFSIHLDNYKMDNINMYGWASTVTQW